MEHSTIFGLVDPVARKHLLNSLFNASLPGQIKQKPERFVIDDILGIVEREYPRIGSNTSEIVQGPR